VSAHRIALSATDAWQQFSFSVLPRQLSFNSQSKREGILNTSRNQITFCQTEEVYPRLSKLLINMLKVKGMWVSCSVPSSVASETMTQQPL